MSSRGERGDSYFSNLRGANIRKPFGSKPQTLSIRTQLDRENMCKQLPFLNIMHDKRVIRGSNFVKKPYLNKECSAIREAEARRRAMARKKALDNQTRAMRLHLGGSKLSKYRQNVDNHAESHLEELYENPTSQSFGAQTDEIGCEPPTDAAIGITTGTDASTQVNDNDLYDFETMVKPIAESLLISTYKQAMKEVLYEDELDAQARHQRALHLLHTVERIESQRLDRADERLTKITADHTRWFDECVKKDATDRKDLSSVLSSKSVSNLLPEVLDDLNRDGVVFDADAAATTLERPEFVPWLMEQLQADHTKRVENADILKDRLCEEEPEVELNTLVELAVKRESTVKASFSGGTEVHRMGKAVNGNKLTTEKGNKGFNKQWSFKEGSSKVSTSYVENEEVINMFKVEKVMHDSKPIMVKVLIEEKEIEMKVDSGAGVSILPKDVYDRTLPYVKLEQKN
ncbi:radial spoke head protein 3 homolog B-like [Adelges cooleyi]|uniref:radial spoke head protein 3 homolog B-like n=1 Tax=Adelges cooleyi TaxID=133065 RepID=UPI00217F2D34|nr:radial spoke head protein 3 homolog B-like [Adelges cooleyi]